MRVLAGYVFAIFVLLIVVALGLPAHAAGGVVIASSALASSATDSAVIDLPVWMQIATIVVTAASSIAALLPTPKSSGFLSVLRKLIDLLALNFGGAKNASAVKNPNDIG